MSLIFLPFTSTIFRAIHNNVEYHAGPNHYRIFTTIMRVQFTAEDGNVDSLDLAKGRCVEFYNKMYHIPPHPALPVYTPSLPHHETPLPGLDIADPMYRMEQINKWRVAERQWAGMLSKHINAPKPELKYYLNDPSYDWYVDYQIDPHTGMRAI